MEFVIKIYGAPYGFDLYDGTAQELSYFQVFDNGSTEPVKMTIHRLNSNQISYNYLRYGYVTSGGRTGSFFGLSVVFNKTYCSDFMKMYQLFEAVYGTIVKSAVLLEAIPQGQWQAKYKIMKFAEAESEVERIKGVLAQNIQGVLANDIKAMSFPSSVSGDKELLLPSNINNDIVSNAVKKYTIVSISPAFIIPTGGHAGVVIQKVPLEVLMRLPGETNRILSEFENWNNQVNDFQQSFHSHQINKLDVKQLAPQYETIKTGFDGLGLKIEDLLGKVQEYRRVEPSNLLLMKEQEKLATYKDRTNKILLGTILPYEDNFKKVVGSGGQGGSGNGKKSTGGTSGSDDSSGGHGKGPSPIAVFFHKYKTKIVAASVVLALIVGGVVFIRNHEEGTKDPDPVVTKPTSPAVKIEDSVAHVNSDSSRHIEDGRKMLADNDYVGAYSCYRSARNSELMVECRNAYKEFCLEKAKKMNNETDAIAYFNIEMSKVESNITNQDRQIIINSINNTNMKNTTPKPVSVVDGTVKIGDGTLGTNVVPFGKSFELKFSPKNDIDISDADVIWYIDDNEVGKGRSYCHIMNNAGDHTAKCIVKGKTFGPYSFNVSSRMSNPK